MMDPCEGFAEKLVDYADGELPEDEAPAVADHLAECDRCRRTVQALNRSLGLAKAIWSDTRGDSGSTAQPALAKKSRRIGYYTVAACILIAASVLVLIVRDRYSGQSPIRLEELERQIARTGAAAELLMATEILARCAGTEALVERQYRFILKEYAGTPAAESIRTRLSPESRRYVQ